MYACVCVCVLEIINVYKYTCLHAYVFYSTENLDALHCYVPYISSSADEVLLNKEEGHILRTKTWGVDEGGVAAGFAGLDSPCLI